MKDVLTRSHWHGWRMAVKYEERSCWNALPWNDVWNNVGFLWKEISVLITLVLYFTVAELCSEDSSLGEKFVWEIWLSVSWQVSMNIKREFISKFKKGNNNFNMIIINTIFHFFAYVSTQKHSSQFISIKINTGNKNHVYTNKNKTRQNVSSTRFFCLLEQVLINFVFTLVNID